VNRYLATLGHLFTPAVKEWRLLDRNPVRNVSKKKAARGRVRFLSDAEREALLGACAQSNWPALHTFGVDGHQHGCQTWRAHQPEMDGRRSKGGARDRARDEKRRPAGVAPGRSDAHRATRMKLQGSAQSKWVFQQPSGLPGPDEGFDAHWYAALKTAEFRTSSFTICATHARVIWPQEGRAYLRSLTHSDIVRSRCQSATRTSRRRTR